MIYHAMVGSFHNIICAVETAKKLGFDKNKDSICFLIHRKPIYLKWNHVSKILKHHNINANKLFIETINEKTFNKKKVENKKLLISSQIQEINTLITNFNYGINFYLYKTIFDIEKVILIDDGLINCSIIHKKNLFYKNIQHKFLGLEKINDRFQLGLNKNLNAHYTIIDKKFLKSDKNKTFNISKEVSDFYSIIINFDANYFSQISKSNSLLFCSNHAVQSKRINKEDYFSLIKSKIIYVKSKYEIDNLYICMHPAEPIENLNFYSSLGFINLNKYSAEFYLQSNKFKYCLHPCNSVPLICESIKPTKTNYLSYFLPGMPNKKLAIEINKHFKSVFV